MVECLTTQRTSILIVSLARSQKAVGLNLAPANSFFFYAGIKEDTCIYRCYGIAYYGDLKS